MILLFLLLLVVQVISYKWVKKYKNKKLWALTCISPGGNSRRWFSFWPGCPSYLALSLVYETLFEEFPSDHLFYSEF